MEDPLRMGYLANSLRKYRKLDEFVDSDILSRTKAFPNMPVSFWGADGPDKYHKAYFSRFNSKPYYQNYSYNLTYLFRCLDPWRLYSSSSDYQVNSIPWKSRRDSKSFRCAIWLSRNLWRD
jgi:hypothetical protein